MYTIIHAIIAVLLIGSIVIQHRASGLSATFGGSGETVVQRRGAEKTVYNATILLSVVFFGMSILQWYVLY